jgi:predicted Mrr-cat superfamily restriction endonuclease
LVGPKCLEVEIMNVWRLITHHKDKDAALSWTRQNSRVAIGWGAIGDIREQGYHSAEDIRSAIRMTYPDLDNSHLGGPTLWDFYAHMQPEDLIILSANRPRVLVAEVEGDYEWVENRLFEGYQHQRRVNVRRDLNAEDLWHKAGEAAPGQNNYQTLIRCALTLDEDDL